METTTKTNQHYKIKYKVLIPYSDESLLQKIEVNGKEYVITYLPRPCKNYSDLFSVYNDGIRFSTFAKFLKSIK